MAQTYSHIFTFIISIPNSWFRYCSTVIVKYNHWGNWREGAWGEPICTTLVTFVNLQWLKNKVLKNSIEFELTNKKKNNKDSKVHSQSNNRIILSQNNPLKIKVHRCSHHSSAQNSAIVSVSLKVRVIYLLWLTRTSMVCWPPLYLADLSLTTPTPPLPPLLQPQCILSIQPHLHQQTFATGIPFVFLPLDPSPFITEVSLTILLKISLSPTLEYILCPSWSLYSL